MEPVRPLTGRSACGWRVLLRGESAIFFTGMALAGILLSVVVGAAIWSAAALRAALKDGRTRQVRAVGTMLSESAEMMLSAAEVTGLRRMVIEAGQNYKLQRCRVVLTDGSIVADVNPLKINLHELPATWTKGAPKPKQDLLSEDQITLVYPLVAPGRGGGRLEITAGVSYPFWACWEAQTGLGVIGVAGLLALLLVYRDMRSRLRAIGAIREALLAVGRGEKTKDALAVNVSLGIEAEAWNEILQEKETLSKSMVADRAKELLGAGREANGELGAACDAMSQGLVLVDNQMKVKYANGAAAVFLHAQRDSMLGADISELILEEEVVAAIRSVACGSARRRSSVEIKRSGDSGTVVLRVSVRPVRREDFAAGMIVIEDVTQQRVADQARNAFVAQATHELRTPLTNIRLYLETAIEEGEKDPAVRANCLNVMNQESRRLERMVGDILSVAEIEAGSLKVRKDDVRLDAMFAELEADYKAQAESKGIELAFILPPKLPVIQGDREKLALAVHNLLGNGLKYTPSGGKVSLAVETGGNGIVVEVKDTGIGIDEADRAKIFEKFYRADDSRVAEVTGSGLGLALAREVVRLHGGDITVDSQVDQGSTFTLTLPVHVEVA